MGLVKKLRDEIERMRADIAGDQQRLFHYEGFIVAQRAEIDRLRAELDAANDPTWPDGIHHRSRR